MGVATREPRRRRGLLHACVAATGRVPRLPQVPNPNARVADRRAAPRPRPRTHAVSIRARPPRCHAVWVTESIGRAAAAAWCGWGVLDCREPWRPRFTWAPRQREHPDCSCFITARAWAWAVAHLTAHAHCCCCCCCCYVTYVRFLLSTHRKSAGRLDLFFPPLLLVLIVGGQ